jgi:transcriptional regulator with XRE-family HTH domain
MAGHRPFRDLVAKMSPEAQKEVRRGTTKILAEMELAELRQALHVRQVDLANKLNTTQAAISRLEKRSRMLVKTLGDYVEALGGKIEVHAVLPGRTVSLTNFFRDKTGPVRIDLRDKTAPVHKKKATARRARQRREQVHA